MVGKRDLNGGLEDGDKSHTSGRKIAPPSLEVLQVKAVGRSHRRATSKSTGYRGE